MVSATHDPLIGKTLEKVRILSKLGSGGMGAVYLAEHQNLGKKVAIKILPEHLSKDPEYVARFRREAETCAKLEHANIVQVYDVGVAEGRFFIVMQYVEGESLQTIIEQLGVVEPRDSARVAIGILKGLQHAHESGIVHRDVKPDNILLTKGNHPKILDFGLAIETEATQKLTADGTVVGTPYFISPEQAKGRKAEPRSDIYSLGVTLYYMITGRVPFTGQTALAVLNMHIQDAPIPPIRINAKIPQTLNDVTMKLLAKRPEDRYGSAELAQKDLVAFLENRPVEVALRKPAQAPRPTASNRGIYGVIAGVAVLFAVLGIAIIASRRGNATTPDKPPVRPDPGPVVDTLKPERERLEALAAEAESKLDDFSYYSIMLGQFDAFAASHPSDALREPISAAKVRYQARIDGVSENEFRKVEPKPGLDVFGQIAALRQFPRALLSTTTRGRAVAKELADLDGRMRTFIGTELAEIDALIDKENFDAARSRLRTLSDQSPEQRDRIQELKVKLDDREPAALAAAALKLRGAFEAVEARVNDAASKSVPGQAWKAVLDFVASRDPSMPEGKAVRLAGLDYAALAKIDIERAEEAELEVCLAAIERALPDAKDTAGEAAMLLDDLARAEWMLRRASKGIQRVSGGGFFLEGSRGIIAWGDGAPTFAPDGGSARPIILRGLPPADAVALAAAADFGDTQPAVDAFQKSKRLCLAAGAAYLHSRVPDRVNAARRWFTQASALGAAIPAFRTAWLDTKAQVELERLSRDYLAPAHRAAEQKKWDEVVKALDDVEAKTKNLDLFLTLGPLIRSHRVRFYIAEMRSQLDQRAYGRVKEIATLLRKKYENEFEEETVNKLAWSALLGLGNWNGGYIPKSTSFLIKGEVWGWDGKKDKTPPPAKIEDETMMRLDRGQRMMMNPEKTEGTSGMTAKIRLNDLRQAWSFGFFFDVTENDTQAKWVVVNSNGNIELLDVDNRKPTVLKSVALPAAVQVGKWVELSWVADKETGEVVIYLDRQPVFAVKSVLDAKNAIGLSAEGDVSFKELRLRK